MKKSFKLLSAMLMVVVLVFSLTGCGVDMSKMKGDWKVKTIDAKTPAEYVTAKGILVLNNVNITDDKITLKKFDPSTGSEATETYNVTKKSNGIEGRTDAHKDEKNPDITFELLDNGTLKTKYTDAEVIYEKGTLNLAEEYAKIVGVPSGEEEGGEEGGEEGYEEGEED